jgi:hypothetical protein
MHRDPKEWTYVHRLILEEGHSRRGVSRKTSLSRNTIRTMLKPAAASSRSGRLGRFSSPSALRGRRLREPAFRAASQIDDACGIETSLGLIRPFLGLDQFPQCFLAMAGAIGIGSDDADAAALPFDCPTHEGALPSPVY